MANRRTQIEIVVLNLADLQAANTALSRHNTLIQKLTASYQGLNGVTGQLGSGVSTLNQTFNTFNTTTNNTTNNITNLRSNLTNANSASLGLLGSMLRYRAVSLVFEGVTKSVGAVVQGMIDLEKQSARVQRVSAPGSTPAIRATLGEEVARTGADIKDVAEAYYQLKTQIKDNDTAFGALRTSMNLVVGTESDARDTTRAILQIYNQFGDQLGQNVDQAEKLRRAGELLAGMWKGSAAEISEITAALKYLGPIAESAHVPLEQVAATISALTFEGVRGRMAGTEAGQFIAQIIKNMNLATGFIENKGAKVKIAFTAEGGVDLIQTIKNINDVASRLPVETAQKFTQAISGSMNAARLMGTANPEFLRVMDEKLRDATNETHGLTNETEALRKTMTTTAQEWQKVWGGSITYIANLLDLSGIRGYFHDTAEEIRRGAEFLRRLRELEGQNNQRTQNELTTGPVRGQVLATQTLVQQALQNLQASHNAPTASQLFAGSQLDIATKDMTPPERAMIRHRYLPGGDTLRSLDEAQMQRDLATMQAQLANPHFGMPAPGTSLPAPAVSGTSLGLSGLTPAQMNNAAIIAEIARRHNIDPIAMISVAYAESGLNAQNVNASSGATGLFQFLRSTRPDINRADARANAEAAAQEITSRQSGHGAMPPGLTGQAAARWIVENFERPGPAGVRIDMAGVSDFYRRHTSSALGGYTDPKQDKAAEEAARKQQEILDLRAQTAQIEYDHAKKLYGLDDARTTEAAKRADALAAQAGDAAEKLRLKYGLSGNVAAISEEQKKAIEDARKEQEKANTEALKLHKDATEFYAETAQTKYGILSPVSELRARQAQQAAIAAAKNDGDLVETWALLAGTKGPLHDFLEARKEELRKLYTSEGVVQTSLFPIPQAAIDAFRSRPDVKAGEATAVQKKEQARAEEQARQEFANRQLEEVQQNTEDRLRAIDRQAQSGGRFGDPNARERAGAQQSIDTLMVSIDELTGMYDKALTEGLPTEQVQQALHDMSQRVLDTTERLHGLNDALAEKELQRQIRAQDEGFDLRSAEITRLHGLRFNKDEEKSFADEMQKLRDLLANDQERLRTVLDRPLTDQSADQVRESQKRLKEDRDRLADYPIEYGNRKYAETYNQVKTELTSSLMNFFHGQGDITQVFKGLGSQIVDSALESQIKRFSDPLIQTTTKQILEIQGNTEALKALDRTMSGGGASSGASAAGYGGGRTEGVTGFGAVVAAGVAAGMSSTLQDFGWGPVETQSGTSKKPSVAGTSRESDLQKGIGAGLAAYSIGSTSASQGVNAGNFLGGVVSGASIGSTFGAGGTLIGGIVGGAIDLIGGLFHHASKPTETPQDLNPAYYNAPSGFDVAAYNYSAYGKLPTMQDVGFTVNPAKTPIVNVYVDGAKVAAKQVVSQQGSSAAVNLVNTTMARHAPV